MDKFSILPTDERFLNLFEEQKLALFEGVCSLPDQKVLKRNVLISKRIEEITNSPDKEIVAPGLQKRTTEFFRNSGLPEEEIKKKIKEMIDKNKRIKIQEMEELRNA